MKRSRVATATVLLLASAMAASGCIGQHREGASLAVCVAPPPDTDMFGSTAVAVTGSVIDVGDGFAPSGSCLGGAGTLRSVGIDLPSETIAADTFWFSIADTDGTDRTFEVVMPEVSRPMNAGDMVTVDYVYTFGGFSADVGHFELWGSDGELDVWIAQAGGLDDVDVPVDVTFGEGRRSYTGSDSCGRWGGFHLDVVTGGESTTLRYGDTLDAGGLRYFHGGYERTTSASSNCADWFVAHVALGAVPWLVR